MINFFRRIRRRLLNDNKFSRYTKYAIGEVVLIMLGIFMAIQLQNWNEKRKQQQNFNTILEQIYNALHYDVQRFTQQQDLYTQHINTINELIANPNDTPINMLPFKFFDINYVEIDDHPSDVVFHVENLSFTEDNTEENELFKHITNYVNELNKHVRFDHSDTEELFDRLSLPWPTFIDDNLNNGINKDSTYYLYSNLKELENFRNSPDYLSLLQKIKFHNTVYKNVAFVRLGFSESLIQQIKTYNPEVKLIFTNVGIIGTSLDGFNDVGGTSTPMTLTDAENDIWQATLYLKEGFVKFRCNDSWFQNWGAEDFPKGKGKQDGPNIPIPKTGTYHIKFKTVTGEYEFIKVED